MRASTLFALTAAVLIGLGLAVAARMTGYFNRPVEQVVQRPVIQVLVAAKNLFTGDSIDGTGVRIRPLRVEELDYYNKHKDQFLPPVPAAAVLRIAKNNIEADSPITRDQLKEFTKPAPLNERLLPDMRAVNLILAKERSAGGLIQVGEWVEVNITSTIDDGEGLRTTRTATIAPKVRVIAKRDSLWQIFAPLPKDKPVEYTLEVNAYRAALIEFARSKGNYSMSPLPQVEQKKLEAGRQERLSVKASGRTDDPLTQMAPEDVEEVKLVQATERGEINISELDMVGLFNLKKETAPPPPATQSIELFSGTRRTGTAVFTLEGNRVSPGAYGTTNGPGRNNASYPPYPYSANVDLNRGKIIPNNYLQDPFYGYRGPYGAERGGTNTNSQSTWRFGAPDCPTCKKNKV